MCEKWVGDWTKTATYWPQALPGCSRTSFFVCWTPQPGAWGPSLCWVWFSLFELGHWLHSLISNWSKLPVTSGYITIRHPPAFCERHICTQFNPSTVKVIPWYFWPDAPVIYTGAFLIRQLGWVGGKYVTVWAYITWPKQLKPCKVLLAVDGVMVDGASRHFTSFHSECLLKAVQTSMESTLIKLLNKFCWVFKSRWLSGIVRLVKNRGFRGRVSNHWSKLGE